MAKIKKPLEPEVQQMQSQAQNMNFVSPEKLDNKNAPAQPVSHSVTFNPDNSVTYNGQTITKEQYNNLNEASKATAKEDRYNASYDPMINDTLIKEQQMRARIADPIGYLKAQQMSQKMGTSIQPQEISQSKQSTNQNINQPQIQTAANMSAQGQENRYYGSDTFPAKLARAAGIQKPQLKPAAVAGSAFSGVAIIYDAIDSLFHSGKGMEQREAETTMGAIESDIKENLKLVQAGLLDPQEVQNKIQMYKAALARLQSSIKGHNKLTLRYALLHGKDVQDRTELAMSNMDIWSKQLEQSQLQYNLASQQNAMMAEASRLKFGI